jgi:hypothetical protein
VALARYSTMVRTTGLRCDPLPVTTVLCASTRTTTLRRARETVRARMTTVPVLRTVLLTRRMRSGNGLRHREATAGGAMPIGVLVGMLVAVAVGGTTVPVGVLVGIAAGSGVLVGVLVEVAPGGTAVPVGVLVGEAVAVVVGGFVSGD